MEYRQAQQDFDEAQRRAFWRSVLAWLRGKPNELLPFDAVRRQLPVKGQHYRGLQVVPLERIVGSVGRYRDFDRAFLPRNPALRSRWVRIDAAMRRQEHLPPVELYQIGDVYFVKDGNHRVSVARQRGLQAIDAYVTEVQAALPISPQATLDDLEREAQRLQFLQATGLQRLAPDLDFTLTLVGEYARLREHIETHRWLLGEQRGAEVPWEQAVASWLNTVYRPLREIIYRHGLLRLFPGRTETDLYLWLSEYQWVMRQAYREQADVEAALQEAAAAIAGRLPRPTARALRSSPWLDAVLCGLERTAFLERTRLQDLRPEADVTLTLPGKYEKLIQHIATHRWYLGEERGGEVPWEEAVVSWYDRVYLPLVEGLRALQVLDAFPRRTEADLYLWVMERREEIHRTLGWEVTPEAIALALAEGRPLPARRKGWRRWLPARWFGPPVGQWRRGVRALRGRPALFADILVALGPNPAAWAPLDLALRLALPDGARVHGLHVLEQPSEAVRRDLGRAFERHCRPYPLACDLAFVTGRVARQLCRHAALADLVVVNLAHPPGRAPLSRLGSGIRTLIHYCPRPLLLTPGVSLPPTRALLAYDGSPKSDEALYLAEQLSRRRELDLVVVTVAEAGKPFTETALERARRYLEARGVAARYLKRTGDDVGRTLLETAGQFACDLFLVGGYGGSPLVELVLGSTLNALLRQTRIPLLLCR